MLGIIRYERAKGKMQPEEINIGPLKVVVVALLAPESLPGWRVRRKVRWLARDLWRLGVRQLIVPENLPYSEELAGFYQINAMPFYRETADVLALACLKYQGKEPAMEKLVLAGSRLSLELMGAAERLYPRVRELSIQVPGEKSRYAGWLHRQYGVPVSRPDGAALTVAFAQVEQPWGMLLPLYEQGSLPAGLQLEVDGLELPKEWTPELLAALWERGAFRREQLRVAKWG
jgi:hypothetical protein